MDDIEKALRLIDFSRLSAIKEKLLKELLENRWRVRNDERYLDLDELDQVVAARGNKLVVK